jgi:hypothetical protein
VRCTPIRLQYTSQPFAYDTSGPGGPNNLAAPFWLRRSRFLRDAAPQLSVHLNDTHLKFRGTLGRVIGVVEAGECVKPRGRPDYVVVSVPYEQRHFVHAWIEVGPAPPGACGNP